MRTEFATISAAFDLMPTLAGNGGKLVAVSAGGTALEVSAVTYALVSSVVTETAARMAADTTNATSIATEATARAAADAAEVTARNAAIAVETAARLAADVPLLAALNATWHDVTVSRVLGTTYTNARAYPISIMVVTGSTGGGTGGGVTINGVVVASTITLAPGLQNTPTNFTVPPGLTYSLGIGGSLVTWFELF